MEGTNIIRTFPFFTLVVVYEVCPYVSVATSCRREDCKKTSNGKKVITTMRPIFSLLLQSIRNFFCGQAS